MYKQYVTFDKKIVLIGFGTIGKAVLPLIFRHIDIRPDQLVIINKNNEGEEIARDVGVTLVVDPITKENYQTVLAKHLHAGDFLLNLSVDVSSAALIQYCQENNILYLDTCIEPWEGGYVDNSLPPSSRSSYAMRDAVLALRHPEQKRATAVITHGANPGLISHFVKQALVNLAHDVKPDFVQPTTKTDWAELANDLSVKVMHVAERDTQLSEKVKLRGEFVNTWSIDGFVSELCQPAELGWGTHEQHWPEDGARHDTGSQCAIYLHRPGATTRVRTWTPMSGPFHGYLITHTESVAIADYFTLKKENKVVYRPTVHFAYHPCEDAVLSLHELVGKEWTQQETQRVLFDEIVDGVDELGILLMGHAKGAYWFGSQLSIHEARELAPFNNATSLQVAIGALSGMIWAMEHPECGLVEPDDIDYQYIMNIALPYLGPVLGRYTDWSPLQEREKLFSEKMDKSDPWQFLNIRVN